MPCIMQDFKPIVVMCKGVGVVYVPTIRRRRLGLALRRLRESTGRSADSVAEALGWSQSKVSRIETATIAVSPADVRALLELYDADSGEAAELVGLAVEDRQPAWWRQYGDVLPESYKTYLGLESQAVRVVSYQSEVLPGLLQTRAYAHEILRQHPLMIVPYEIEQATELRLARQARLRGTDPLQLDVVISESALRCVVGGRDVMREQLAHLYEMTALSHVTVRVLPFEVGAHPATNGSFHIVEFPHPDDPRILCLDALTVTFYREDRREVETYLLVHERLRTLALDPQASRAHIGSMIEDDTG
jgi:transcriptional regulator with XRE-family HTH domain